MNKVTSKLFALLFLSSLPVWGADKVENAESMRSFYGLNQYANNQKLAQLKIAVIDNGFEGVASDADFLPESKVLVEKYDADFIKKYSGLGDPDYYIPSLQTAHGRAMAQIVWAMTGSQKSGPKFFLLNGNGITNFRRAVWYAIDQKVDVVLYSQNRECCGNFDGGGFLNSIVSEATKRGIIWINAAGNYGGQVYNGKIEVGQGGWLKFGNQNGLRIKSKLDANPVDVILNWNSNGEEENTGTEKDLDLFLVDAKGKQIAKSELKQVLKKEALGEGETFLPRERLKAEVSKSDNYYWLQVKAKGTNWDANDRLRIVLMGEKGSDALDLVDATRGQEIMAPADHPDVITVGDLEPYSAVGPTMDGRQKPEILLEKSEAIFSSSPQPTQGTSNAAAYFAGIVLVLKSHQSNLNRAAILRLAKQGYMRPSIETRPVPFADFAQVHPEVLSIVDQFLLESPMNVGLTREGYFLMTTRKAPSEFLATVCSNYRLNEQSRIFLYYEKNGETVGTNLRKIYCIATQGASLNFTGRSPMQFVEIKKASPRRPGSAYSNNDSWIWKTPKRQDLVAR